jgi:hypothetical protein
LQGCAHAFARLAARSLASYPHEPVEEALRRFAAARKQKLPAALELLRTHVQWAQAQDLPSLRRMSAAEVLGVPPEAVRGIAALFPHFHVGFDREGRPVTHIYGEHYAAQPLFQAVPPERVGRFHVWRTERMLAAMYARRAAGTQPLPPGTLTAVVSVAGMTMRHVTKDFLALVKLLAVIDQNHYPERCALQSREQNAKPFLAVGRVARVPYARLLRQTRQDVHRGRQPPLLRRLAHGSAVAGRAHGVQDQFPDERGRAGCAARRHRPQPAA